MSEVLGIRDSGGVIAAIEAEIERATPDKKKRIQEAIILAAFGGIPWVGAVIAAASSYRASENTSRTEDLMTQWLKEHEGKFEELKATLEQMFARFDSLGRDIHTRIESTEYLSLVRKSFRQWDEAETQEKRGLIVKLITHAAGTRICSDDILRLFLDWMAQYHEAHFAVIKEIFKNPGVTRYDIWIAVYGEAVPREDAPEADLYRMLIRDLSTGGVIRQARETDAEGRFRKKTTAPRRMSRSSTMESSFEDTKQYVLTGLGGQFVHYTMTELVTRIESGDSGAGI